MVLLTVWMPARFKKGNQSASVDLSTRAYSVRNACQTITAQRHIILVSNASVMCTLQSPASVDLVRGLCIVVNVMRVQCKGMECILMMLRGLDFW